MLVLDKPAGHGRASRRRACARHARRRGAGARARHGAASADRAGRASCTVSTRTPPDSSSSPRRPPPTSRSPRSSLARTVRRVYLAVVHGRVAPAPRASSIRPIGRHPHDRTRMAVRPVGQGTAGGDPVAGPGAVRRFHLPRGAPGDRPDAPDPRPPVPPRPPGGRRRACTVGAVVRRCRSRWKGSRCTPRRWRSCIRRPDSSWSSRLRCRLGSSVSCLTCATRVPHKW